MHGTHIKKLYVFDFDDTLVKTDACVKVTRSCGETIVLTPQEFIHFKQEPGDIFDFSQFDVLINPREISWTCDIARGVYAKHGPHALSILTARGLRTPIEEFLHTIGTPGIDVGAVGTSDPEVKASWIDKKIRHHNIKHVEYFDDSHHNVLAVGALQKSHPNVNFIARHIVHRAPSYRK